MRRIFLTAFICIILCFCFYNAGYRNATKDTMLNLELVTINETPGNQYYEIRNNLTGDIHLYYGSPKHTWNGGN